jgi:hypothetical protein
VGPAGFLVVPRYHFHILADGPSPDPEGVDLPDVAAARIDAVAMLGQMLRDRPEKLWRYGGLIITCEAEGRHVFQVHASAEPF